MNWGSTSATVLLAAVLTGCAIAPVGRTEQLSEDAVRAAEGERLRSLVDEDLALAERRHASDFHVVNPLGRISSKNEYLRTVLSRENDYLSWLPGPITVHLHGRSAAIRYTSAVDIEVRGRRLPRRQYWNTGLYEHRDGRWQIVWFQVTEIRPSAAGAAVPVDGMRTCLMGLCRPSLAAGARLDRKVFSIRHRAALSRPAYAHK